MSEPCSAIQILKNEYGISTVAELNEALKALGHIDISIFCSERTKRYVSNGKNPAKSQTA